MDLERNQLGLGQKPALVAVDMIKGFTDPACPLGCACPEVVAANAALLQAFHRSDLPVYFTTVVYHSDQQARVFRERVEALNVLTPESEWVKVDPQLPVGEGDELIEKQWASAFHKTDLDSRLRARGVDSLVVTGLTTSGCVRATCVDAMCHGFIPIVVADACGDRHESPHEANLFDMQAKYADVVEEVTVINYLEKLAADGQGQ